VQSLALGACHALLLTSAGAVFALGTGCASGQLGLGAACVDAPRPRRAQVLRGDRIENSVYTVRQRAADATALGFMRRAVG
jgi:hypothetical protein